jgi:hypothetical protein
MNDAIRQMMADVKTFSLTADPSKGLANNGTGTSVLQALTTGDRNTGFGYYALKADTTGNENTGVGYLALTAVIGGADPVGSYNTAFGSYALASLTTGYKNTAVGRASSDNLTTGNQNVAVGYGSFHWASTAVNCTAIGFEAVHGGSIGPITGQGITGVGFRALYECLGDFNTAVGTSAAASMTSGARNTAIGVNALNTQLTGADCVGLGYGAGLTNSGSGNIFVGAGCGRQCGALQRHRHRDQPHRRAEQHAVSRQRADGHSGHDCGRPGLCGSPVELRHRRELALCPQRHRRSLQEVRPVRAC